MKTKSYIESRIARLLGNPEENRNLIRKWNRKLRQAEKNLIEKKN